LRSPLFAAATNSTNYTISLLAGLLSSSTNFYLSPSNSCMSSKSSSPQPTITIEAG